MREIGFRAWDIKGKCWIPREQLAILALNGHKDILTYTPDLLAKGIVNCNSFQVEIAREYFTSGNYPKHSTKEMDEAITAIDECNKSHYGDECDICRARS